MNDEDTLEQRLGELETRLLASLTTSSGRLQDLLKRQLDGAIAQIEALISLNSTLNLVSPLAPTRGWAASPDLLVELVRQIDQRRVRTVVELGSGVSTVVMAAAMRRHGGGHVYAIEHEHDFADATRTSLEVQGLTDLVTFIEAPLGSVPIGSKTWRWYRVPEGLLPNDIDLLFVDGPPAATGRLARYPALPVLHHRLAHGAIIVMDDTGREDEREIASRWLAEYPGMTGREIDIEKGAWLLVTGER